MQLWYSTSGPTTRTDGQKANEHVNRQTNTDTLTELTDVGVAERSPNVTGHVVPTAVVSEAYLGAVFQSVWGHLPSRSEKPALVVTLLTWCPVAVGHWVACRETTRSSGHFL